MRSLVLPLLLAGCYEAPDLPLIDTVPIVAKQACEQDREGAGAGGALGSGMAAAGMTMLALTESGDHVFAASGLYGATQALLAHELPRRGVETTFVDPRDPQAFRAAIRPETRLVYGETLGNPGIEVMDIPAIADVAHDAGLPLMIDSTFTTPHSRSLARAASRAARSPSIQLKEAKGRTT